MTKYGTGDSLGSTDCRGWLRKGWVSQLTGGGLWPKRPDICKCVDFAELDVIGGRGLGPTLQLGDGNDVYDEIRLKRLLSRRFLDLGSYHSTGKALI